VVATLPLMSWLFSRTGLFDRLAELARRWPRIEIETPEAVTEAATWIAPSFSCHPRMPPDAASMLLLVNDVCFALLLTVLFYFGFIALVLHTLQQWLTAYERLEAGSPPLNPAEHFAMRQLDAMRAQLLSALRAEPRAQHKLESDAKLKTTVESGSLYVSHFIGDVGHAQLKILVDFTPSTWAIMEAYFLVLGGALFFCACWRSLTLFFDVLWYGATIYLGWRLLLHGSILRQIERDRLSRHREDGGGFLRTGWPHEWIDRLLFFVVGPGVTGFRPWAAPSAPVGCRCIQVAVLVQFYRIGAYLTDPVNAYPFWDLFFRELPKLSTMLLWALWIAPGLLEVFSLPPFLSDLEISLLLQTAKVYPDGLPSDDMLLDASAGGDGSLPPRALSPLAPRKRNVGGGGSALRTPSHFSTGLSYVVQKGLESEKTWWSGISWRGMRQAWRWLTGSPQLADPARRLADHHAWIVQTGGEGSDIHNEEPPVEAGRGGDDPGVLSISRPQRVQAPSAAAAQREMV